MARRKYRKKRKTSTVRDYSYDPYYSSSSRSGYRKSRSKAKGKTKKKNRISYKMIATFILIIFGIFMFFNFSLIYQEFLYLTVNKGIQDGKVVLFGDSDFSVFEDPNPTNPPIVARNNDYSIIIPKIGLNTSLIEDIDLRDENQLKNIERNPIISDDSGIPGDGGKIKIFGHYPIDDLDNVKDSNTPFLITYKLKNGDYIYLVHEDEIYKYEVIKSDYKLMQIEDSVKEIDEKSNDNLYLISYGPLFDNVWSYVVEAKLMDEE